jgi:electron transfer flavoprotein alpha subunit
VIAVVVVRDGVLPVGADEAVAEAGGDVVVVGSKVDAAAADLRAATVVRPVELGAFAPGAWAQALAPALRDHDVVVLPASPDGRDLAPRLAHALHRPLLAGAVSIAPARVILVRRGGLVAEEHPVDQPIVATLVPGVRGVEPAAAAARVEPLDVGPVSGVDDPEVLEVLPPDPATVDLSEATRIVSGGAGLGGPEPFAVLQRVALALGASYGASRVAADVGWVPQDRFIGTTGVMVDPRLYVALGISGAVQHVTGLGDPDHIVAVNTDASAPMMAMADLAIVTDARALLDELATRLGVDSENEDRS